MPAAKEKPILFSGPMVRAILDGRKTQTRRPIKPQPEPIPSQYWKDKKVAPERQFWWPSSVTRQMVEVRDMGALGPLGPPGTLLWVREKARLGSMSGMGGKIERVDIVYAEPFRDRSCIKSFSRSDWRPYSSFEGWTPSIHMPRWASRISLCVKRVWVERVQDISEEDAKAEGIREVTKDGIVKKYCLYDLRDMSSVPWADMPKNPIPCFSALWKSAYPGSWDRNEWVWVCEFERVTP